jgi:alpha-amylase
MYYGLEQELSDGAYDPYNREALWLYNDYSRTTPSYVHITLLNKIRTIIGKGDDDFVNSVAKIVAFQNNDIALLRAGVLIVLTNVSCVYQV